MLLGEFAHLPSALEVVGEFAHLLLLWWWWGSLLILLLLCCVLLGWRSLLLRHVLLGWPLRLILQECHLMYWGGWWWIINVRGCWSMHW